MSWCHKREELPFFSLSFLCDCWGWGWVGDAALETPRSMQFGAGFCVGKWLTVSVKGGFLGSCWVLLSFSWPQRLLTQYFFLALFLCLTLENRSIGVLSAVIAGVWKVAPPSLYPTLAFSCDNDSPIILASSGSFFVVFLFFHLLTRSLSLSRPKRPLVPGSFSSTLI